MLLKGSWRTQDGGSQRLMVGSIKIGSVYRSYGSEFSARFYPAGRSSGPYETIAAAQRAIEGEVKSWFKRALGTQVDLVISDD